MRRYDEKILNRLMDRYENSLLYEGKNRRRQTISVPVTKSILPEYFDEGSVQYEVIHAQLAEMEQKGYLSLVWKNQKEGHILEKCVLCTERADDIYTYLHRLPRKEKERRILEICAEYDGKHPVIDEFLDWIRARLEEGKSTRPYADPDQPEQFSEHRRLALAIWTNTGEMFLREFSVQFCNDSKAAERRTGAAVHLIQEFSSHIRSGPEDSASAEKDLAQRLPKVRMQDSEGGASAEKDLAQKLPKVRTQDSEGGASAEKDLAQKLPKVRMQDSEDGVSAEDDFLNLRELEPEQVLEEFGIYKNPSWVMLKGCGRFSMDTDGTESDPLRGESRKNTGTEMNLKDFPGGIGLAGSDIALVRWDTSHPPKRVVTIENLTSFHRFREPDTLAIYLGGYHNRIKRRFLRKLYDSFTDAGAKSITYAHFGDLDCGGFRIWKDLREKTDIPFQTLKMDEETYRRYLAFGRPLTENDRAALKHMAEDPFFSEQKELFRMMLEEGLKLEQECVR